MWNYFFQLYRPGWPGTQNQILAWFCLPTAEIKAFTSRPRMSLSIMDTVIGNQENEDIEIIETNGPNSYP